MDSDSDNYENYEINENNDKNEILIKLIKENPIILNKSQIPEIKAKKMEATKVILNDLCLNHAIVTDEKKLSKKLLNLKQIVKKKSDINQTGNRKIVLKNWEKDLLDLLNAKNNPVYNKITGSISTTNSKRRADSDELSQVASTSADVKSTTPKKEKLPRIESNKFKESEETKALSLSKLIIMYHIIVLNIYTFFRWASKVGAFRTVRSIEKKERITG